MVPGQLWGKLEKPASLPVLHLLPPGAGFAGGHGPDITPVAYFLLSLGGFFCWAASWPVLEWGSRSVQTESPGLQQCTVS